MQEEVGDISNEKTKQPCSKALQEERGHNYPDNLTKERQSHNAFKQMPNGLTTNPAHCPKKPTRQHLPLHPFTNNYNQQHGGLGRDDERLIFVKKNSLCECKDCSKTNDNVEKSNLTKIIENHKQCDCMECSTKYENNKKKEPHDNNEDGTILSDTSYSNGSHMSGNVTDKDETTSISHAHCKHCNAEDSDEEQSEDEEDDGVISPNTSYSNGIHTSGDDMDKEEIINIPTSDDNTTLQENINNC